jgi:hypothetical protein
MGPALVLGPIPLFFVPKIGPRTGILVVQNSFALKEQTSSERSQKCEDRKTGVELVVSVERKIRGCCSQFSSRIEYTSWLRMNMQLE